MQFKCIVLIHYYLVSELYGNALEILNSSSMGSFEVIAKNLVDILRKQRNSKEKNWVFACLPYQQRLAKLVSDEFFLPLGGIREMVQVNVPCVYFDVILTEYICDARRMGNSRILSNH